MQHFLHAAPTLISSPNIIEPIHSAGQNEIKTGRCWCCKATISEKNKICVLEYSEIA